MIKESDLIRALGQYAEQDLMPAITDPKAKAAIIGFVAAVTIKPDFVLRLLKNAYPQISAVIEDGDKVKVCVILVF